MDLPKCLQTSRTHGQVKELPIVEKGSAELKLGEQSHKEAASLPLVTASASRIDPEDGKVMDCSICMEVHGLRNFSCSISIRSIQ